MGMLLTGRRVSAQEAYRVGLVNEVVPLADLLPAARRWADQILECAPLSVQATKGRHGQARSAAARRRSLVPGTMAKALDSKTRSKASTHSGRGSSAMVGSMKGTPLGGVMVLDFTQIEMGPCATQVLGDFGADVIKIERPGAGDLSRVHMQHESGESAIFWSLNRNKRSVAIDVRAPLGREAIYRFARKADVLVHNFRPGVMERLGFGPERLSAVNPRLIYAFGSGYGPTGPYRDKGGQDVLAQAMSGIASRRAEPDSPPEPCATPIADFTAGMLLVQAILLALLARERTGRGQVVHVSLLDGMLAMQLQEASAWLNLGRRLSWGAFPCPAPSRHSTATSSVVGGVQAESAPGDLPGTGNREPLCRSSLRDARRGRPSRRPASPMATGVRQTDDEGSHRVARVRGHPVRSGEHHRDRADRSSGGE
jgi:hypothetical protein